MTNHPSPPASLRDAAFVGPLGEFAKRLEPHTEADLAAILIQGLVAFGNIVGRTAHFVVEGDTHFSVLNAVLVGESAKGRKGVSWRRVRSLMANVDSTWPEPPSGLSSGEGLIYAVRDGTSFDDIPAVPQRYEPPIDLGVADKRLLVVEEEFGRVLQSISRKENTLSAVIRLAFDTGNLRVMTRNCPLKATGAHVSVIGHVTCQELKRLLTSTEYANGFANRILWPFVRRSKELPDGGNSHLVDFSVVEARLKKALEFARQCGELRRDPAAAELWRSEYSRLSRGRPGLLGGVTSRAEAYVMRLALVYAVLDCSSQVALPHLEAGLAVWRYCEDSARYIFGDALGDHEADTILAGVRTAGDKGMTRTEISQLFSGNRTAAQIERALGVLSYYRLAESHSTLTEGRSIETWFTK